MCRKLIVTNKLSLGNRSLGYEAWSLPKGELVEFTEKQLKDNIRSGGPDEVYGLKISEESGELVFDDSFFVTNMMNKLHINTLVPIVEGSLVNMFYIVLGTHKVKNEIMYDVISSRYERTSFTAEKVKTLLDLGIISAGAKLENGEIVVAPLEKPQQPEPTIQINGEEV